MKTISVKVEDNIKEKLVNFSKVSKRSERHAIEYLIDRYISQDGIERKSNENTID